MERLEQACDVAINRSTDWTAVYCQFLAFSIVDPLFHAERFGKAPVKLIQACLANVIESKKDQTNANSIATAKLSTLVYGALGGKAAKPKLEDFLPYEIKKSSNSIKESTMAALKWALKNKKMPSSIVGLIGAELG